MSALWLSTLKKIQSFYFKDFCTPFFRHSWTSLSFTFLSCVRYYLHRDRCSEFSISLNFINPQHSSSRIFNVRAQEFRLLYLHHIITYSKKKMKSESESEWMRDNHWIAFIMHMTSFYRCHIVSKTSLSNHIHIKICGFLWFSMIFVHVCVRYVLSMYQITISPMVVDGIP